MSQLAGRYSPDPQQAQAGIGSMFGCDHCSMGAEVPTTLTNRTREACRSVAECRCQDPEHSIELPSGEMQGGRQASNDGWGEYPVHIASVHADSYVQTYRPPGN